jgi:surface protein
MPFWASEKTISFGGSARMVSAKSLPWAPTEVTGTSGNSQIELVWSSPAFTGTGPISDYLIQYSVEGSGSWTTFSRPASSDTSATVTGLTNATSYVFRVAGVNDAGVGPYSDTSHSLSPFAYDPAKLTLVYDTSKEPANNTISVPLNGTVNCTVEWGDGTSNSYTTSGFKTKTYASPGIYVVQISGTMTSLSHGTGNALANNRPKVVRCLSFGNVGVASLGAAFRNLRNFVQCPLSIPSAVQSMSNMFLGAWAFNQPIGRWNTSSITNMASLFFGARVFNQPIGSWNTASVIDMSDLFNGAIAFNQPVGQWNTSSATTMQRMFYGASSFNQPISGWDVSKVQTFETMLESATAFNQNLGSWSFDSAEVSLPWLGLTGMSQENYSRTLIGWANWRRTSTNTTALGFGASGLLYNSVEYSPGSQFKSADVARNYLTSSVSAGGAGWVINNDNLASSLRVEASPSLRQVSAGSQQTITVKDAVFQRTTGGDSVTDFVVSLLKAGGQPTSPVITSGNTAILTNPSPQSGGTATYVAPGVVTFTGTDGTQSATAEVVSQIIPGSITDAFSSFVSGSASASAVAGVDSRLAGKTAASSLQMFTSQNHTASPPSYARNASFWASDIDLTCCSAWNSTGLNTMAGTLVSPRHIVFAAHYQINSGATVRFVSSGGGVVDRTMTAKVVHPSYSPYSPDLVVGLLDSDVPAGVGFARVLPANFASYFPTITSESKVPLLVVDQEEKGLVFDWTSSGQSISGKRPSDSQRSSFSEQVIVGDSGNPAFLIVNNQPVLLTVLTFGGFGFSGTNIALQREALNSMMTSLGGGYQLTSVDLSNFPTY